MLKPDARGSLDKRDAEPSEIILSAAAIVTDIVQLSSRQQMDALDDEHLWMRDLIDMRFNYKPRNPLYLLILRAYSLSAPITIANTPDYAGCKSWVPLDSPLATTGSTPALDDARFDDRRKTILDRNTQTGGVKDLRLTTEDRGKANASIQPAFFAQAAHSLPLFLRPFPVQAAAVLDRIWVGMANGLSILLVDDHHDTTVAMTRLLMMSGHRVVPVESCAAALAVVETLSFDLYLLDVALSDGDGCELLLQLLKRRRAPAIAITGYSSSEDRERFAAAGFAGVLVKPITLEEMLALIERVRHRGERDAPPAARPTLQD